MRQVAAKVRICDLKEGQYVRVDGEWEPNYVMTPASRKVSRANIMAVVATQPDIGGGQSSFLVDDGTAQMTVRLFEEREFGVAPGDVVTVIGRPRQYGDEIYVVPEIVKKISDPRWVNYRLLELQGPLVREETVTETTPADDIVGIIRSLDKGDGADMEEVLSRAGSGAQEQVDRLMKEGEIFEITSGKLKVLE